MMVCLMRKRKTPLISADRRIIMARISTLADDHFKGDGLQSEITESIKNFEIVLK